MRQLVLSSAVLLGILFASPASALLETCKSTCTIGPTVHECDQVCNPGDPCVGKGKRVCNGTCDGGVNDGLSCDSEDECPDPAKLCVGGTNDGLGCATNSDCPDEVSPTKVCLCDPAGNNPNCGNSCTEASECKHLVNSCNGGPNEGMICVNPSECPDANCRPDPDDTPPCKFDVDNGTCVGGNAICAPRTTGASVLCAVGVSDVTGSKQDDTICLGDGDVSLTARGGNDLVRKGLSFPIKDALGVVQNPLGTGNLNADLGPGDDNAVNTGEGDDLIFGGGGVDTIVMCGGRNVIHGGDDNDVIAGTVFCLGEDRELGSIYCGGKGNDTIFGMGPSHHCMDGGDGDDSCTHMYFGDDPDGAEDEDLGTARNCESESPENVMEDVPCGCETKLP